LLKCQVARCFIASVFRYTDIDAIYDHCILPVLKQLSVTAIRVDRVEHNEDIDNKIFELLDAADFVIADLTYASTLAFLVVGTSKKAKNGQSPVMRDHLYIMRLAMQLVKVNL
jgi:hypothetical protein